MITSPIRLLTSISNTSAIAPIGDSFLSILSLCISILTNGIPIRSSISYIFSLSILSFIIMFYYTSFPSIILYGLFKLVPPRTLPYFLFPSVSYFLHNKRLCMSILVRSKRYLIYHSFLLP